MSSDSSSVCSGEGGIRRGGGGGGGGQGVAQWGQCVPWLGLFLLIWIFFMGRCDVAESLVVPVVIVMLGLVGSGRSLVLLVGGLVEFSSSFCWAFSYASLLRFRRLRVRDFLGASFRCCCCVSMEAVSVGVSLACGCLRFDGGGEGEGRLP